MKNTIAIHARAKVGGAWDAGTWLAAHQRAVEAALAAAGTRAVDASDAGVRASKHNAHNPCDDAFDDACAADAAWIDANTAAATAGLRAINAADDVAEERAAA